MGLYLRKSCNLVPLRLNLSKSGLGLSLGAKGLQIGSGPRGAYLAGGRKGLYLRQSLAAKPPCLVSAPELTEEGQHATQLVGEIVRNFEPAPSRAPAVSAWIWLGLLVVGLLLLAIARAVFAEPVTIHFTFGVSRTAEACWEHGDRIDYQVAGRRYHIPRRDVATITGTCEAGPPPAFGAGPPAATETTPPAAPPPSTTSPSASGYSGPSSSSTAPKGGPVDVKGYTRKDGTYVQPHTRSAPGTGGGKRR